jgi:Collagen triple helix repeat (20 copies)
MLSAIRKHINPATILAFVALIFAMTGGAFAVTGHGESSGSTATAAKAKPKVKTGPRGPAGPKGATGTAGSAGAAGPAGATGPGGPQGPQGPAGNTGEKGADGTNGTPGINGESVTIKPLNKGGGCGEVEGTEFSNKSGKGLACNGKEAKGGSFPEFLPEGSSETGVFIARFVEGNLQGEEGYVRAPISFTVPLEVAPREVEFVTFEQQEEKKVPAICQAKVKGVLTEGSAEQPLAAEGVLCIYQGITIKGPATEELTITSVNSPGGGVGFMAGTTGGIATVKYEGPALGKGSAEMRGSWAVTAE